MTHGVWDWAKHISGSWWPFCGSWLSENETPFMQEAMGLVTFKWSRLEFSGSWYFKMRLKWRWKKKTDHPDYMIFPFFFNRKWSLKSRPFLKFRGGTPWKFNIGDDALKKVTPFEKMVIFDIHLGFRRSNPSWFHGYFWWVFANQSNTAREPTKNNACWYHPKNPDPSKNGYFEHTPAIQVHENPSLGILRANSPFVRVVLPWCALTVFFSARKRRCLGSQKKRAMTRLTLWLVFCGEDGG